MRKIKSSKKASLMRQAKNKNKNKKKRLLKKRTNQTTGEQPAPLKNKTPINLVKNFMFTQNSHEKEEGMLKAKKLFDVIASLGSKSKKEPEESEETQMSSEDHKDSEDNK